MIWVTFFLNFGGAVAFTVVAAVLAKRIGGIGPWLLAAVGAIDAFLLLAYRLLFEDFFHFDAASTLLLVLEGGDALLTMFSVALVLFGFGLMMPKTVRRG